MGKLICVAAISKIIVMQALYMLLNTGAYSISVGAAPYVTISPNKCSHIPYVFWPKLVNFDQISTPKPISNH